jgi:hypothetical protein
VEATTHSGDDEEDDDDEDVEIASECASAA